MPVEWVRVRHEGVGGETDIPSDSADYQARGGQVADVTPRRPDPVARSTRDKEG